MTPEDRHIRNALLRIPPRHLTPRRRLFLKRMVLMEHAINTRRESMMLARMANELWPVLEDFTSDPGCPETYDGQRISLPEPTDRVGGPGGIRPEGTGDGMDDPDDGN